MGNNPNNFSAPKRNSLLTISGTQDPVSSLVNWQNQLTPVVSTALPAPTPQNFSVTSARSGLQLSWSPIPNNTSVDGFEIVRSQDGSFTDDLKVIPISGAQQSSYFDSLGGSAATAHYRIRATSGTAANPQSVRGPDSGVVSHTSIDSGDTTTKPSTKFDQFTTDATRSQARKGNYGAFSALTSSLGQTGGSGSGSGAAQNGGTTTSPIAPVIATFDKIGTGENVSANMTVGEGASIGPDTTNPGIINATEINGIPIFPGEAATTVGKIPISQGDGTAIFGDPTVQGVYEDGTSVASPGTSGDLSTIQPVLVAGKGADGNMHSLSTDNSGKQNVIEATLDAAAVAQGTTAPTKILVVGGKSNDGTPQYKEIPLGAGARSVIVEGVASAVPISAALYSPLLDTYSALASSFTPAANPTTLWEIVTTGAKKVRLVKIVISCAATAASSPLQVEVGMFTSLKTGGTKASPASRPINTSSGTAVSTVNRYTVNSTGGGTQGAISFEGAMQVPAAGTGDFPLTIAFGDVAGAQSPIIQASTEQFYLSLNGASLPSGFVINYIFALYTEQ